MQQSTDVSDPSCQSGRAWVDEAIRRVEADANRSADTHLIRSASRCRPSGAIDLYLKDESTHPDRLAQAPAGPLAVPLRAVQRLDRRGHDGRRGVLGLDRGLRGLLRPDARPAVRRRHAAHRRAPEKIALIEFQGGRCHLVDDPTTMYAEAAPAGRRSRGGHYIDQFTYAERATDWRGNNNIAESIFEPDGAGAAPDARAGSWSAPGTGGTRATIGRYVRYRRHCDRSCASSTRRTRRSSQGWRSRRLRRTSPARARASRASAGRGSSRRSSPTSSTG